MLNLLDNDTILYLTSFLSFNSIIIFSNTTKIYNNLFDDKYFNNLAIHYYSEEFWKAAINRTVELSKPLRSYKLELLRLEEFQNRLEKYISRRWTISDFYFYWDYQEQYYYRI